MTSAEIRQSFLDFFAEKQHTIVPSASLLPQSPGLLFTNAGMNPFVPYFLGVEKAPYDPPRAADTQKCIRAGGKHNDLEDVGYDTYHHTFFEMLGNWSFGNYFKKEAIQWAWELVIEHWGLPAHRLYASVYAPKEGDPGNFDQEAYDIWAELFISKGCDPAVQIVHGNVKDNFWMMGETGPCGPCSELHVDLTPEGNPVTGRNLVNNDSDLCIEIWNLVFIQYNAEADGSFRELPAKHVDTGMGFERACSIIQCTQGFTDFTRKPSNYDTDVFQPIFRKLEALSGKTYRGTFPSPKNAGLESLMDGLEPPKGGLESPKEGLESSEEGLESSTGGLESSMEGLESSKDALKSSMEGLESSKEGLADDIAFRVIADHLRTLSFSIADGIMPGNNGRNYVLRRILRRAVKYGRQLGFSGEKPFFGALVETLVNEMGGVFPELKNRQDVVRQTLEQEEASFNQTLGKGIELFDTISAVVSETDFSDADCGGSAFQGFSKEALPVIQWTKDDSKNPVVTVTGDAAFLLYDTFGFPVDLTALLCAERGFKVDQNRFEELMEQQQERSRSAQKSNIVRALDISTEAITEFLGFDADETEATILEIHPQEDALFIITDKTVFYAEMGGQSGDTGILQVAGTSSPSLPVVGVQQIGKARALIIQKSEINNHQSEIKVGDKVTLRIDPTRRRPIEAHHTATHLLHWALHEAVSKDASQQGSSVDEHRLRFDFNSAPLTPEQLAAMEEMVNGAIKQDMSVSWTEVKHADIKGRADIMQFFGDKYGEIVRVVEIGGKRNALDGYSMELCGGTHVRNTSEIGLFKIKSEGAIASGVRRIEAVCGEAAWNHLRENVEKWDQELKAARTKLKAANDKLTALGEEPITVNDFPHIMPAMLVERADIGEINATFAHGARTLEETQQAAIEAEKRIKKFQSAQSAALADESLAELISLGKPIIVSFASDASLLQELQNGLKKKQFSGPALLIVDDGEKLHLATHCGPDALAKGLKAGDLLRDLAALAGGKGGGKPDQARGAAPDRSKLETMKSTAISYFEV
ncbi:MAG: alanine--tRNA ligase [Luteolibacter sp.]